MNVPKAFIACCRVGQHIGPGGAPPVRSRVLPCYRCWSNITITPASLAKAEELDAMILCMQCVATIPPEYRSAPLPPTPDQDVELEEFIRKNPSWLPDRS